MSEPPPSAHSRHVGQIFFQRAAELGGRTFIKLQTGESFEEVSWREFGILVGQVLLGLCAVGIAPGETVAIVGENCLPWLAADLATLAGGFPNVVLAPSLSDGMFVKVLGHAQCRAAFVENAAVARRLVNLQRQLPALQRLIVMDDSGAGIVGALNFRQLLERGAGADGLAARLQAVQANDLATIMYTSGSTGEPKGVMRSQDNLLANITNGGPITVSAPDELSVNILSLNHLFGRFGFLKSAVTGRTTALIEAADTKVDLPVIEQLSPTGLALVPRIMERIWQRLLAQDDNQECWRILERLDAERFKAGLSDADSRCFDALRAQLGANVRRALGGRIKYVAYGGAAMPPRIMRFFELIGLPLIGSYGSTECGGVTLCGIGDSRPGNLGKPFANVQIRIAADGEILVRGSTVSPGYFKNPEATREAFNEEGWYYTGDIGLIEADGSLKITGRKKDIFNCADGSNIYPGFIELQLENEPYIGQAVLVGDRRPFIAALIFPDGQKIAESLSRDIATLSETEITAALSSQIERVNGRLESYERIRRIAVVPSGFPADVRSINHFHKVKVNREQVAARYRLQIDAIYRTALQED
ncbi:MAG TPA: AMP-binding protein [Candidatus Limnocylindria bacterium]|nr:AMP-binding protein [Candidatus Limnocylindria bacterium]